MRSILSLLLVLWLMPLSGICAGKAEPIFLTIATGGPQGNYYASGRTICNLINRNKDNHGIRCSVALSDGSLDNLKSIRAGEYELGIVQSDWQYHAFQGTSRFTEREAYTGLRSLFALYPETFAVVVRNAAGIERFEDLRGKRVDFGSPDSGTRATAEMVIELLGFKQKDFQDASELKALERLDPLCHNKLDAVVMVVGHPNQVFEQATRDCDSKIIGLSSEIIAELLAEHPYLQLAQIPGGMYHGMPQALPTFAVAATLVSRDDLPDAVVFAVVEAVFENLDELKTLHPFFSNLNKLHMISEALTAPLHPGALRYYQETGLIAAKPLKPVPNK